jgi:hypothetical protein
MRVSICMLDSGRIEYQNNKFIQIMSKRSRKAFGPEYGRYVDVVRACVRK